MRVEVGKHNRNNTFKDSPYLQSLFGGGAQVKQD